MKGAIIGDIVGSRFEMQQDIDPDFTFFTPANRFTDDSAVEEMVYFDEETEIEHVVKYDYDMSERPVSERFCYEVTA